MAGLDGGQWYSVALTSMIAAVILRRYVSRLLRLLRKTTKHYHEPFLLALGLLSFLAGNICLVLINVADNDDRQKRAATAGALGLCLILVPGRTNMLAQAAGVSFKSYYLAHHWVAFVAGSQGALHAGLVWPDQWRVLEISGLLVAAFLVINTISYAAFSFFSLRQRFYSLYITIHSGTALGVFVSLLLHTLSSSVNFYKILWISGYALVWAVMFFFRVKPAFSRRNGRVESIAEFQSAAAIRVQLSEKIPMYPGAYFYLCLQNGRFYRLFGLPVILYSWKPVGRSFPTQLQLPEHDRFIKGDTQNDTSPSKEPRTQHPPSSSKGWKSEAARLAQPLKGAYAVFGTDYGSDLVATSQKVFLDGPYGQDIHLENFKTVTLVAEGCGIFGTFPHAMFLAQRAFHNRDERRKMKDQKDFSRSAERLYGDMTRKVNLFWVLELQAQDRLATSELSQLMSLDDGHALLHVYILYPKPIDGAEDTLRIPDHVKWMRSHGTREHQYKLLREILVLDSYGSGSSAVLSMSHASLKSFNILRGSVSGKAEFVNDVHKFVHQAGIETRVFQSEYPETGEQTTAFKRATKNVNLDQDVEKGNVIQTGTHHPTLAKRKIRVENIRRVP